MSKTSFTTRKDAGPVSAGDPDLGAGTPVRAGSGHCLCGAVRFTLDEVPQEMEACHCADCRRMTGGAPLLSISVLCNGLHFNEDAPIGVYRSSDWAERGFCRKCGSTLFFRMRGSERVGLSPGLLDDMNGIALTSEMFFEDQPDGYCLSSVPRRITKTEAHAMLEAFLARQTEANPGEEAQ
ncbi:MAG: GFA family protein [Pseudomonadota bacterium]